MLRQSSSRIHRSRGSKVKNVLQVCFLVVVSLWLIYQVKHSHDKRKDFDENDATARVRLVSTKIGRKDLHPRLEETTTSTNPKHDAEDETEDEEVEEGKHGDEKEPEQEENNFGESRDDEVDDDEDDILDEEKKREENGLQEAAEKHGQIEKTSSSEDRKAHEAREELYKADDASSEVTHEIEAVNNKTLESSTQKTETNSGNEANQMKAFEETTGLKEERSEIAQNVTISPNVTEEVSSRLEENLLPNSTVKQTVELPELGNNLREVSSVTTNLSLQNETEAKLDLNVAENATSGVTTSGDSKVGHGYSDSNDNQSDSNLLNLVSSVEATNAEPSNATVSSELAEPEKVKPANVSLEITSHDESSTAKNQTDVGQIEKSEIRNETDDSSGSYNADPLQRDHVESTNTLVHIEDKNSQAEVDLGVLPEINSKGSNKDDPTAE